jgi:Lon protease-like protein
MISKAYADRGEFGIVRQGGESLQRVGCAAKVREVTQRFGDGRFNIQAMGTRRFVVHSFDSSEECLQGAVEFFEDDTPAQANAAKVQTLLDAATRVLRLVGTGSANWEPNHPWLTFRIAADLPVAVDTKQVLLETRSELQRVDLLTGYLRGVIAKREQRKERERLVRGNGRLRH